MKKILAIMLGLAVTGSAALANESEKPKTPAGVALMRSHSGFKLFYKGETTSDIRVTIYNPAGEQVYSEVLRNIESFVRPYDVSTLGEGEYTIEVEGKDGRQVQKVVYSKTPAALAAEKLMHVMKVPGGEEKYMLMVSNKGKDVLDVRIYDKHDNLLYNETQSVNGDFAKIYNLSKIGKDATLVVTDKKGRSKTFNLTI